MAGVTSPYHTSQPVEFADIQSMVFATGSMFTPSVDLPVAVYELLTVTDAAAAGEWLLRVTERLTTGATCAQLAGLSGPPGTSLCWRNLAITAPGLTALGVSDEDLATFDIAFVAGMHSPRTQQVLGDTRDSGAHPETWAWGADDQLHLLLCIAANSPAALDACLDEERAAYAGVAPAMGSPLRAARPGPPTDLPPDVSAGAPVREHFGFADGLSQPDVAGFPDWARPRYRSTAYQPPVAAGEFVLGYRDQYGYDTLVPRLTSRGGALPVGVNGSYFVLRQLEQDVAAFWTALRQAAGGDPVRTDWLAAKSVGRWPSGAPLRDGDAHDPPDRPVANDFDFTADPIGRACPVGSHVRRANPRAVGLGVTPQASLMVANRHRILRRGRSYGPRIADRFCPDAAPRGLYFGCINASIDRQFEVVQHSWLNDPAFGGVRNERDPLVGVAPPGDAGAFSVPATPYRERFQGMSRFVTMKGGGYFFLPGIRELKLIAQAARPPS